VVWEFMRAVGVRMEDKRDPLLILFFFFLECTDRMLSAPFSHPLVEGLPPPLFYILMNEVSPFFFP
jgi:hypothetical protein